MNELELVTVFTPWRSLAGGTLIGLAALLLLWLNGRIAGISGILGGLAGAPEGERSWRLAFLAGLLVGFGTHLGSGCTSGHGVCGLARLSPRSIAATGVFMAAAVATVLVSRHLAGA